MDDYSDVMRNGARDLAGRVRPAAATTVRARGDVLRRRRVAAMTAAAAGCAVIVGGVAVWSSAGGGQTAVPSTPGSSSTAGQAAPPVCKAGDLAVTTSPWTGRTGHVVGVFVFHNIGSATCRMSGYPVVTGVNAQGVTTTTATDTLAGWGGTLGAVPMVDVPSGGYASAAVEWRNGTDNGGPCALVSVFEVAPPSGGRPAKVPPGADQRPSLTDGTACSSFQIHPVVSGFDSGFWYPPYSPPVTTV
jgi:hypothetical protein